MPAFIRKEYLEGIVLLRIYLDGTWQCTSQLSERLPVHRNPKRKLDHVVLVEAEISPSLASLICEIGADRQLKHSR
jgi:hypothetical protein